MSDTCNFSDESDTILNTFHVCFINTMIETSCSIQPQLGYSEVLPIDSRTIQIDVENFDIDEFNRTNITSNKLSMDLVWIFDLKDIFGSSSDATFSSPLREDSIHLEEDSVEIAAPPPEQVVARTPLQEDVSRMFFFYVLKKIIVNSCDKYNMNIYLLFSQNTIINKTTRMAFNHFFSTSFNEEKYYDNVMIINFSQIHEEHEDIKTIIAISKLYIQNKNQTTLELLSKWFILNIKFQKKEIFYTILNYSNTNIYIRNKYVNVPNIKVRLYTNEDIINQLQVLNDSRNCFYGRMMQYTGTCWLNTIMNSLFLPYSTRNLFIEKTIELIEIDEKNRCSLEYVMSEENYSKLSTNNIISSIIYNIYIKKERNIGDLNNTRINFVEVLNRKFMHEYAKVNYIHNFSRRNFEHIIDYNFGRFMNKPFFFVIRFFFINYLNLNKHSFFIKEQDDIKDHVKKKYTLISKLISIKYKKRDGTIGAHIICHIKCNNNDYIYDSNNREPFQVDKKYDIDLPDLIDFLRNKYGNTGISIHNKPILVYVHNNIINNIPIPVQRIIKCNSIMQFLRRINPFTRRRVQIHAGKKSHLKYKKNKTKKKKNKK